MNTKITHIKRALISVSDKTGLVELAVALAEQDVEIISTGGTAKTLTAAGINTIEISDFTGFPEMMDGRVKTLHPKIHGGILGLRDEHQAVAAEHDIKWIDLVVCNLYPFGQTIQKPGVTPDEALANIDIGGPSMIRSAAKNVGWVSVVVDPADYSLISNELRSQNGITLPTRQKLSAKAFGHTAAYDTLIYNYFSQASCHPEERGTSDEGSPRSTSTLIPGDPSSADANQLPQDDSRDQSNQFCDPLILNYKKLYDLRYGENPHQPACVYTKPFSTQPTILNAIIHQGKQLSYNNINDADAALALTREFTEPACVVVKHTNPCGVATGSDITEVFNRAYQADALSAFGGVISLNRPCTAQIASAIAAVFAEIVIAPSFEPEALAILATKKNLRVLEVTAPDHNQGAETLEYRFVEGGLLAQEKNHHQPTRAELKIVTKTAPSDAEIDTLLFAWSVLKHMKSNAILIAKNNTTVGVGVGQVSRVDAVEIALKKAGDKLAGSILASDAFFPFRDSIDKLAGTGIRAIIQPGGSVKDRDVIDACNEHGIAMVFTGIRCFKH